MGADLEFTDLVGNVMSLSHRKRIGCFQILSARNEYNRPVIERFRAHLFQKNFWSPGSRMLVGYSGGADSTCLVTLLTDLGVSLVAAHLHHGQRQEADDELAKCEEYCRSLGIGFICGRADVPRIATNRNIGLEEAGRLARYAFFEDAKRQMQCDVIATAHTQDDLVETVILNLARGSGIGGLVGIPEVRGDIIRPFMIFTRDETRSFCLEHGLWFHDDPANAEEQFARVRVRKRIIPELESLNPQVRTAIVRLSQIARDEEQFLNGVAASALEQASIPLNAPFEFLTIDCEALFDKRRILGLPKTVCRRAMRLIVESLGGEADFDAVSALISRLEGEAKGSWTAIGGGIVCEWDEAELLVRTLDISAIDRQTIQVPGIAEDEGGGWEIRAHLTEPSKHGSSVLVHIDAAKIQGDLHLRVGREGDKWQPLGMSGHKSLSETFAELRLTAAAKKRLPIVCDMIGILWVPGKGIADRVKVTDSTMTAIRLEFDCLTRAGEP